MRWLMNECIVPNVCLSPINCESPSIVINSNFYRLYSQGFSVYLFCPDSDSSDNGQNTICLDSSNKFSYDYLFKYILAFKSKYVNIFNAYDKYYLMSKSGRREPLYYVFACGKCNLCRAKKSSEYSFRSACETHTYPLNPLFVTLTYKDDFLPSEGLVLSHLQNFFKRLRFRLNAFGLRTDFRYLAVGEYGAKSGRPHYHIIFWNLPISDSQKWSSLERIKSMISYAWTTYKFDSNGKRICVYSNRTKKTYYKRCSFGISKILPVEEGCPSYITKYFRKEQHNLLGYPGKNFLVSSRKSGGIGSSYIDSQRDFVLKSPNVPSLSVVDQRTGKIFSYPVTGYIKSRMFGTLSQVYSRRSPSSDNYYDKCVKVSNNLSLLMGIYVTLVDKGLFTSQDFDILHPLKYRLIRLFCKHSRHFFKLDVNSFYKENYSYFSKYSYSLLLEMFRDNLKQIQFEINSFDFTWLDKLNDIYLQTKEIQSRLKAKEHFYFYNIDVNVGDFDYLYSKYLQKCFF